VQKDFAGIDAGFWAAPAFADIDGDHRIDLFVGEGDGGVNFFQGTGSSAVGATMTPPNAFALKAYPNPFHEQLNISLRMDGAKIAEPPRAVIYNLTGARVAELAMRLVPSGSWRSEWLPAKFHLAAGVYFLKINFGRKQLTQKILFIH
jgi:hypothetical protein